MEYRKESSTQDKNDSDCVEVRFRAVAPQQPPMLGSNRTYELLYEYSHACQHLV